MKKKCFLNKKNEIKKRKLSNLDEVEARGGAAKWFSK